MLTNRYSGGNISPLNFNCQAGETIMSEEMSKADARALLKVRNDSELADAVGRTRSAVSQWSDPLPEHAVTLVHAKAYAMRGKRVARR